MKIAVIILSDPKAGEEALGRMFNGLAGTHGPASIHRYLAEGRHTLTF